MTYQRTLKNGIRISSTKDEHADQLEDLQKLVFPTLSPDELIRAEHYRGHIKLFPEGQFVALDGGKVVGMTSTIRLHFDLNNVEHSFADLLQGGWMTAHEPDRDWLYGMDMGAHPDSRRQGIARGMWFARQEMVRQLGLKGQLGGAMLSGFGAVKDRMSIEAYFEKVKSGEMYDPTTSTHRRVGYQLLDLLPDYVVDPVCDNWAALVMLDAKQEIISE